MGPTTYKADPANTWCIAGYFAFGFVMIVMAAVSSASAGVTRGGASDTTTMVVLAAMGLGACYGGWLALLAVRGAIRGRPRITVSDASVTVETAFGGTRWAEWSSLSGFAVSVVGTKRIPVAMARITGDGVSRNLRGKTTFAVGGAFVTPIAILTDALNAHRPVSAGPAAPPPPEDTKARLAAVDPNGLPIRSIVLIWCLQVGLTVWLYSVLFEH